MRVSEYVDGSRTSRSSTTTSATASERSLRRSSGFVRQHGIAGDPAVDNLLLDRDGRVAVVGFGLVRVIDADYLEAEHGRMGVAQRDADALHAGRSALGDLPEPAESDGTDLLEHLHTAGEWLLAPGVRRLSAEDVRRTLEPGYPPRSP